MARHANDAHDHERCKREGRVLRHDKYATESKDDGGLKDREYRRHLEHERTRSFEETISRVMRTVLEQSNNC